MLTKETAKQVIDSLPNDATMDDIIRALYINVKFSRGEKEIRQGKGIPHPEAKKTRIDSDVLSVAAEFAVASELGRRNIYAQPTFGHRKRTDLLIFGRSGKVLRLEVKGKQDKQWPSCTGISGVNTLLVLADLQGKKESERPDFYVLTVQDWRGFAKREIRRRALTESVVLNEENCPIWRTRIDKNGRPHCGINVEVEHVREYQERWDKITQALQ